MTNAARPAGVGVLGGSGFYKLLDDVELVELSTPYGEPSDRIAIGTVAGRRVAFLPRHGSKHTIPPAAINYRANLWAFKELGVDRVIGPNAAGSLRANVKPGDFVVCDQFVDRTWGRADSFYMEGPRVAHVSAADPYCPQLRSLAVEIGRDQSIEMHDGGTVVVIQGPRFASRAESHWYGMQGWDVVNMTQYPEAMSGSWWRLCAATWISAIESSLSTTAPATGPRRWHRPPAPRLSASRIADTAGRAWPACAPQGMVSPP